MKRFLKWFFEMWFLYLIIFQIILVILLNKIHIGLAPIDNIRVYGLILQLIGSITIVYSLKQKLILFKGFGFNKLFFDWLKSVPLGNRTKTSLLQASIHENTFATAEARAKIRPEENIPDIIRYYDEEIEYLHKRLVSIKIDLEKKLNVVKSNVEGFKANMDNEIRVTKKLISDTSISNIGMDIYGVITIITGLIYGTIPDIVGELIY